MNNLLKATFILFLNLFFLNQIEAQNGEPHPIDGNMIKNGGFIENIDPWKSDANYYKETGGNSANGRKSGGFVLLNHNGSSGHDPMVNQFVEGIEVGAKYVLEADVKKGHHCDLHHKSPDTTHVYAFMVGDRTLQEFIPPASTDNWERVSVSWVAQAEDVKIGQKLTHDGEPLIIKQTEIKLVAEIHGTDCDIDFDNVSLVKEKPVYQAAGFDVMPITIPSSLTLDNHKAYAKQYPYDGGGWRLPTVDELRKILPSLDKDYQYRPQGVMTTDVWQTSQYMVNYEGGTLGAGDGEIKPFGANNTSGFYTNKLFIREGR